jgi:hypothetical protein
MAITENRLPVPFYLCKAKARAVTLGVTGTEPAASGLAAPSNFHGGFRRAWPAVGGHFVEGTRFYLKLVYGPARLTSAMLNPRSSVQIRPFRTVMMVRPASVSAIVAAAPSATAGVTW